MIYVVMFITDNLYSIQYSIQTQHTDAELVMYITTNEDHDPQVVKQCSK